jgi:electron transfer flavoprotein alpha subunit
MAVYKGLLVCGEMIDGNITTITKELLNMGRRLGDALNQPLSTLLIDKEIDEEKAREVIRLGADQVYIVNGPSFAESSPDLYVGIIKEVCQQIAPSIILFGHTEMGRDVAPRLAARLNSVVTMDCTDLSINPETKELLQSKPVYGGNAIAIWISESKDPQIVTLRPRASMPAEPDVLRKGKVIPLGITIDHSMIKSELLESVKEEVKGIKLEDAKVIIAGGGGIGGIEGFKSLEELAKVLRGTIGVSRVPCDEGWMPISLEIGQTGHIVTPKLYIAIGISGAPQHMVGCAGSKCIVAINRDPEAQIFKEADFGVVGDYRQVIPPLLEKCRDLVK